MIAAIEWIPAGRANPNPSKYEYSRAEQEFLEKVQAGGELATENDDEDEDEEWEDVDDDDDDDDEQQEQEEVEVPKVDPESLPKDLRMDDYSDDDEDGEKNIGGLLVGKVRFFFFFDVLYGTAKRLWTSNMFAYITSFSYIFTRRLLKLLDAILWCTKINAFPFFGIPVV
jgi:hypothetical protein